MASFETFDMRRHVLDATKDLHTTVSRHDVHTALLGRKREVPAQVFRTHLAHQEAYLGSIESALQSKKHRFEETEIGKELYSFFEGLFRSRNCQVAGQHMDCTFSTISPFELPEEVLAYSKHVSELEDTRQLSIHAWINLADGLFGGTMLAGRVQERWDEDTAEYIRFPDEVMDRTLNTRESFRVAKKIMSKEFAPRFNAIGWTEEDGPKAVAEAVKAFEVVKASLDSLAYVLT